jgi:hypothetical protein
VVNGQPVPALVPAYAATQKDTSTRSVSGCAAEGFVRFVVAATAKTAPP